MNEQQNIHPVAQQLLTWFHEALTVEEINARIGLVQGAVNHFIEEFKKANPEEATATDEAGNEVEVEEVK